MGNSRWDSGAYTSYARTIRAKSQDEIFTNTDGMHPDLDPSKIAFRESVDSVANPKSTPIIIGVDETGSMGHLAVEIIKNGLGVIVQGIYDRKPVTDPHILLAAIGDASCDRAPLQVTQFEADVSITKQIEKFYIEGNGGGNGGESYPIAWWFAANKTKCDCMSKRGRKGYLFTIGDECPIRLGKDEIKRHLGGSAQSDMTVEQLLDEVKKKWNVFHLIIPTSATSDQGAVKVWRKLLGERAVEVTDHKKLGEVIVSIMQVNEGQDADEVAASWDGSTSVAVRNAVTAVAKRSGNTKVVTL